MGAGIDIFCLCAAWCRVCSGYAAVFERVGAELAAAHPGLRHRWIDVEDEAELVGDLDIETFPTLLVLGPEGVRFAGAVTPHEDSLRRLVRARLNHACGAVPCAPADALPGLDGLVGRLRRGGPDPGH
jgi:hypothetical protein